MTWHLIGEDFEAICTEEILPLDWRTKAKGLRAWMDETGDYVDAERFRRAGVFHGLEMEAPPGAWFRGTYIDWTNGLDVSETHEWWEPGLSHGWCTDTADAYAGECNGHPDVLCLGFDPLDDLPWQYINAAVAFACSLAPKTVSAVVAGEDHEWQCRVIRPVTVVSLR